MKTKEAHGGFHASEAHHGIDPFHRVEALAATRPSSILLALLFTALSFLALVFYDLNAIDYIGKRLPFPHVALTAFSAYAVGNTAGFGALSGGAIHYRAYTRLGISPEDIGRHQRDSRAD